MEKTISLALNKVATIPNSLRAKPTENSPSAEISINLTSLYHHYYLDSFGRVPPNPDPAQFEYLNFILPTKDFRFQEYGIGASTVMRRNSSTLLGQAFCRMFLHEHFGITYFAHMEHVLNRPQRPAFSAIQVERIQKGDAPDYFCAKSVSKVFLAEAKGRYSPISFSSNEFEAWRKQFSRVGVKSKDKKYLAVKGYIIGTRFATEEGPRINSKIYAEDPSSPGAEPISESESLSLGETVISLHYSQVALKIGQPLLAATLSSGIALTNEVQLPCVIWRLIAGPNQGMEFVGGYYHGLQGRFPFSKTEHGVVYNPQFSVDLSSARETFIGLEITIFKQVVSQARSENGIDRISQLEDERRPFFYSGFSLLRDGSVIGPLELFVPVGQILL